MSLTKAGAILAVIVPLIGASWYLFDQRALAQTTEERVEVTEKKQRTVEQAVEVLTDIHERQQTVADAEKALTAKLCAEGKLKGADCR
jgi:hypothetical protein